MPAAVQDHFAAALLDADRPIPETVTSHTAPRPIRRFAVYRNNVMAGLVAALRSRFPALGRIVGDEFFTAMACVFVAAHPPRSPLLFRYGDDFPSFVDAFAPAGELPYLADVARLEAARTRAYHAADAVPAATSSWRELDPELLHGARVVLHPSVQVLRSAHPVVTIWAMNSGETELAPIEDWRGEDAVVVRPELEVYVRRLHPGGATFLTALADGASLGDAAAIAAADHADFDLSLNLADLIGAGLAIALRGPSSDKDLAP